MYRTLWFACAAVLLAGCGNQTPPAPTDASQPNAPAPTGTVLKSLKIVDVKKGTGPGVQQGDSLTVTYTGTLANGKVFDSNDKPGGKPFTFQLGYGAVIKGWDEGLLGMKQGGERKLSIPADLGYGSQDKGSIPPNSDLYFDVKLVSVLRQEDRSTVVVKDLKVGTGPALKSGDTAVINYSGQLMDGTTFDSHMEKDKPYSFKVGADPLQVVAGVDAGVVGMKKGGERMIQIPPGLGPMNPGVPPQSVTKFDVILRDIKH